MSTKQSIEGASIAAKEETALLIERARKAQKVRKAAPLSGAKMESRCPQKDIMARINADQGGKNDVSGGWHTLAIPQTDLDKYTYDGYEPAVNPDTKEIERYSTDVFVRCPTEQYEDELKANTIRDAQRKRTRIFADSKQRRDSSSGAIGERVQVIETGPGASDRIGKNE